MRVIALALALLNCGVTAQTPVRSDAARATPDVVLRGRVVAADSSAPIRRARVTLVSTAPAGEPVFSDEQGRFDLGVPASVPFTVRITKAGFAPLDVASAAGSPSADALEIRLARGGVVAGRVVDTDDLGEYRIGSRSSVAVAPAGPSAPTIVQLGRAEALILELVHEESSALRDLAGFLAVSQRTPAATAPRAAPPSGPRPTPKGAMRSPGFPRVRSGSARRGPDT